jgi:hypothetical protein
MASKKHNPGCPCCEANCDTCDTKELGFAHNDQEIVFTSLSGYTAGPTWSSDGSVAVSTVISETASDLVIPVSFGPGGGTVVVRARRSANSLSGSISVRTDFAQIATSLIQDLGESGLSLTANLNSEPGITTSSIIVRVTGSPGNESEARVFVDYVTIENSSLELKDWVIESGDLVGGKFESDFTLVSREKIFCSRPGQPFYVQCDVNTSEVRASTFRVRLDSRYSESSDSSWFVKYGTRSYDDLLEFEYGLRIAGVDETINVGESNFSDSGGVIYGIRHFGMLSGETGNIRKAFEGNLEVVTDPLRIATGDMFLAKIVFSSTNLQLNGVNLPLLNGQIVVYEGPVTSAGVAALTNWRITDLLQLSSSKSHSSLFLSTIREGDRLLATNDVTVTFANGSIELETNEAIELLDDSDKTLAESWTVVSNANPLSRYFIGISSRHAGLVGFNTKDVPEVFRSAFLRLLSYGEQDNYVAGASCFFDSDGVSSTGDTHLWQSISGEKIKLSVSGLDGGMNVSNILVKATNGFTPSRIDCPIVQPPMHFRPAITTDLLPQKLWAFSLPSPPEELSYNPPDITSLGYSSGTFFDLSLMGSAAATSQVNPQAGTDSYFVRSWYHFAIENLDTVLPFDWYHIYIRLNEDCAVLVSQTSANPTGFDPAHPERVIIVTNYTV